MTAAPCPCCHGTARLDPDTRPICATAIQRRDTRSPNQLPVMAYLQRIALRGIAYDDDGQLLDEHGEEYVDYRDGVMRR